MPNKITLIETGEGTEMGCSVYQIEPHCDNKFVLLPLADWEGIAGTCQDIIKGWEHGHIGDAVTNLSGWFGSDEETSPDEFDISAQAGG